MPTQVSCPGVYIEEVPSGVRTITGVATSVTAFIGRTLHGPVSQPVRAQSFSELDRTFGTLWCMSTLRDAVNQLFANGGEITDALISARGLSKSIFPSGRGGDVAEFRMSAFFACRGSGKIHDGAG